MVINNRKTYRLVAPSRWERMIIALYLGKSIFKVKKSKNNFIQLSKKQISFKNRAPLNGFFNPVVYEDYREEPEHMLYTYVDLTFEEFIDELMIFNELSDVKEHQKPVFKKTLQQLNFFD